MTIVDILVICTIVVVPIIIVLGLISPKLVIFSGDKTRARVLRTFGGLFGVMSALTIVVAIATKGETSKDAPAPLASNQVSGSQNQPEKELWDFSWEEVKPYSTKHCAATVQGYALLETCLKMEEEAFQKLKQDYGAPERSREIKKRCMKTVQGFHLIQTCVDMEVDAAIRLQKSGVK